MTTYNKETQVPVIGFDMGGEVIEHGGNETKRAIIYFFCLKSLNRKSKSKIFDFFFIEGTSTDVSRYAGNYEEILENTTAGVCIQAPQVYIYHYLLTF